MERPVPVLRDNLVGRLMEAEREFRTALQLDPNSTTTLQIFAIYLAIQGRFDEASEQAQAVSRMMPASTLARVDLTLGAYSADLRLMLSLMRSAPSLRRR